MFNDHIPITKNLKIPSTFFSEIHGEHLEESSFFYEQRGTLFHDPEISWNDIGEFEDRSEAHIDALVVGGDEALFVCQERVIDGDAGELHAAIRVYCRQKRLDLIQEVLNELDIEDQERVLAVRNALKLEWPRDWHNELERMLKEMPDKSVAVMPAVAGFQRIPAEGALLYVLPICPESVLFPEIKSMGRVKAQNARYELLGLLKDNRQNFCSASALSLLRLGVNPINDIPVASDDAAFCKIMAVSLAGGIGYVPMLLDWLERSENSVDQAFALGVLGDCQAVAPLIRVLYRQIESETVALALNLITGADLYEDVFVPEEIDEDELFEEEIEKIKKGEPIYPPGEAPGMTISQLTQNPETWEIWWRAHQTRFKAGVRYRNGKPYHPRCLLDNLRSERSPVLVRQIAYEELVVRYGIDVPFETDMLVRDQLHALEQMEAIIEKEDQQYEAGGWYFDGRLIQ